MTKKSLIQNALVIVLGLAIICMSVGYAYYDGSNMSATSKTFDFNTKWEVLLSNPVQTENTNIDTTKVLVNPTINEDGNAVNFSLSLAPGDVYEFSIDVTNSGSLNAKLSNYSLIAKSNGSIIPISENQEENTALKYEVSGVIGDYIDRGSKITKNIKITAIDLGLGTEPVNYDFTFNMNYVQDK